MLKYVVILVIILGFAYIIARHDEIAALQSAHESAYKNNAAIAGEADKNHPQEHPKYSRWDSPSGHIFSNAFRWPEGTTVWAIILTLLAIAEQGMESAKATQAMRDSIPHQQTAADAALLNAQAVINAERPWITVRVRRDPELENGFFYQIVNKGRTPAHIVTAFREQRFVIGTPDNLPIPPHYSSPTYSPEDLLLVADDKWDDRPSFNPEAIIGKGEMREAIENAQEFLCFYGQITYRDTFSDRNGESVEHYTRWCYVYDVFSKRMIPSGPSEYRSKS